MLMCFQVQAVLFSVDLEDDYISDDKCARIWVTVELHQHGEAYTDLTPREVLVKVLNISLSLSDTTILYNA